MSHQTWWWSVLGGWTVALLMVVPVAHAGVPMTIYDFEDGLQEWAIPDWAKEKAIHRQMLQKMGEM